MEIVLEEPFPLYAVPRIWRWVESFRDRVMDDFAPKTLDAFVEQWERLHYAGRRSMAVWRDGELGGVICGQKFSPIVMDAHCVFKREFWGHDTTLRALEMASAQMFNEGILKISTMTYSDNHALLSVLKKLGGTREGMLKAHTLRGGKLVDLAVIALHKDQFEAKRQKQEAA